MLDWVHLIHQDLPPEFWEVLAAECGFSPKRIALALGVSDATVRSFVHRRFGCTLGKWLKSVRSKKVDAGLLPNPPTNKAPKKQKPRSISKRGPA